MKHVRLPKEHQFDGPWTDLFILGTTRNDGASDFTAAATTQSFNLLALNIGDCVTWPLANGWVKQKFTDAATEGGTPTTLANLKADVGNTDDANGFIIGVNGDLIQDPGYPLVSLAVADAGGGPYRTTAASKYITAALTSTAGNISTITFGELWIFVHLQRVADEVTARRV